MENNKLIAEFMGEIDQDTGEYSHLGEWFYPEDCKFHTSWDWLMPVAEKCLTTDEPSDGQHYFINDALLTCNIEVVHDRVVEFIKEYNRTTDYNKVTYYDEQ